LIGKPVVKGDGCLKEFRAVEFLLTLDESFSFLGGSILR
jgi:hypothetical protein